VQNTEDGFGDIVFPRFHKSSCTKHSLLSTEKAKWFWELMSKKGKSTDLLLLLVINYIKVEVIREQKR
jgi:hypothetical protein